MKSLWMYLLLAFAAPLWAQWTEPDTTSCPQFGPGIRSPWISNDNLRLYLCTIGHVYVITRDSVGGPWSPLTELPGHINATTTQVSACESPSGDTLYFMSDSDERGGEGYGGYDIYYAVRTDTGWGPAINCGPNVNGPGREWSVGISRDGSLLLISSGGPQGLYLSLYYCEKQTDGTWGRAIDFGQGVNGYPSEKKSPTLSPDNNRLFYYLEGPNMGDILESRKINGVWQSSEPLPTPINSHFETQMDPCLASDGQTLWYRSELHYDQLDFKIMTSTDTTVTAVEEQPTSVAIPDISLTLQYYGTPDVTLTITDPRIQGEQTVTIFDLLGRQVGSYRVNFVTQSNSSTGNLHPPALPSGTYFIRMNHPSGALSAKYIVTE